AIKQGSETGIIPADLQAEFEMLEENANNPDGMRGGFFNKARSCIEAIEDFEDDPSQVDVLKTESWVRTQQNGIIIRGKIDREIKAPLGGVIIQDYKSGRAPDDDEPVSVLSDSFVPMGLYALMRSRGNRPDGMDAQVVTAVQLLYLSPKVKYNIKVRARTLELVERMVDRVTEEMNNTVLTGDIVVSPGETPDDGPCTWCAAKAICPVWSEYNSFDLMRDELGI